ncbi:hypothetical protein ACQP2Y_06550 [Actinoplanes sp. CA-051413]|uniref:hypothetical protein n=1 Tax=Actinoplanes sp. CA-051413 TaxID=3239899 RepID=UPI003D9808AA
MITLTPMLARWAADCPFWPVDPTDYLFPVQRRPTPRQVGTVMWALIGRSVTADDLSITARDATEAIEAYLAGEDEDYAPGGLRVGAGDVVIDPGCCVGLDEWRDWLRIAHGEVIDLGHDPDVLMEHRGVVVRVWQDGGHLPRGQWPNLDEPHIDVPRDALPALLSAVQENLAGFLAAMRPWAHDLDPELADPLTAAVDRRLQISAPLGS